MSRFTDENKWSDKWFRSLSPIEKLVWLYLCDNCDIAGFIELDIEYISFMTKVPEEATRTAIEGLSSRLDTIDDIIWIRGFIKFQKNLPLNPLNNAHKAIISAIRSRPQFLDAQDLIDENDSNEFRVCLTQKEAVWIRDLGVCQYTKQKIDYLWNYELDHILPRSKGGGDQYSNLACCLKSFNREKSDKDISVTVKNYSASQAKKDLLRSPNLIYEFNSFFNRSISINSNGRLVEANGYLAPKDPSERGTGKGKGKGKGKEGIVKGSIFIRPTIQEITDYCLEKNYPVDPERFFNFYESKGWKIGKNPMKDWRACVRTWVKKDSPQKINSRNWEL